MDELTKLRSHHDLDLTGHTRRGTGDSAPFHSHSIRAQRGAAPHTPHRLFLAFVSLFCRMLIGLQSVIVSGLLHDVMTSVCFVTSSGPGRSGRPTS